VVGQDDIFKEFRMRPVRLRVSYPVWTIVACLLMPVPAHAQVPYASDEIGQKKVRIKELRGQARQLRAEARRSFDASSRQCAVSFFNTCMNDAKKARTEKEGEAKRIEKQADNLEAEFKADKRKMKQALRDERAKHRKISPAS
jgi:hypothetical protein